MFHQHVQDHHFMRAESYKPTIINHRDKKSKVFAIFKTILNHNSRKNTNFDKEKFKNRVRQLEKPAIATLNEELKEYIEWLNQAAEKKEKEYDKEVKPCFRKKNRIDRGNCTRKEYEKLHIGRISNKKKYVEKVQKVVNNLAAI